MLLGGIVDQDIKPAEVLHRLVDGGAAELLAGNVAGDRQALPPLFPHRCRGLGGILTLLEIYDGEVGTLTREQDRNGTADATVAAGHDRHLAFEPASAGVACLVRRARVHLGLVTWLMRLRLGRHRLV